MPKSDRCYGNWHPHAVRFLEQWDGRLIDLPDIVEMIDQRRAGRGWPGMTKWIEEEGPGWVNDMTTLVFAVPIAKLSGAACLDFTQQISMRQASLFEYMVEGAEGLVRMKFLPARPEGEPV